MTQKTSQKSLEIRLQELNCEFAIVVQSGQTLIVQVATNEVFDKNHFQTLFANERYECEQKKSHSIADIWLKLPSRRIHKNGLVFDPDSPPAFSYKEAPYGGNSYNLWQGFGVKPVNGEVKEWEDFVLNVIADNEREVASYIHSWIANIINAPTQKSGTSIILWGAQGTGKSFFAETIVKLLGVHAVGLSNPEHIIGRFNSSLENKLLILAEESTFTVRRSANALKNLITAETIQIERKGLNPFPVKNHARIIVTANDPQVIKADHDERRYLIVRVSETRQNDHAYFASLRNWLEDGGYSKLLSYYQHHENAVNLREIPRTKALLEQKLMGLSDCEMWILDCLEKDWITNNYKFGQAVPKEEMQYCLAARMPQALKKTIDTQLGIHLKKIFGKSLSMGSRKTFSSGKELARVCYILPPLAEARACFEKHVGSVIEWPKDEI